MNKILLAKSYVMVLIGQGLAEGRNYLIAKPLNHDRIERGI